MNPLTIGLGVTGLAGQIFGANASGKANREMARMLRERDEANEAFYNNSVNRTFLDTNAAKGVLERAREQYQDANQIVDNKGVVTGATPEAVIAAKTANNEALNDVVSSIAEQATGYQDAKEQQYQANKNAIVDQQMGLQMNKAQNAANLSNNAGNLLAGMIDTLDTPKASAGTAAAIVARENNGQKLALDTIAEIGTDKILGNNYDTLNKIWGK